MYIFISKYVYVYLSVCIYIRTYFHIYWSPAEKNTSAQTIYHLFLGYI